MIEVIHSMVLYIFSLGGGNIDACKGCMGALVHLLDFLDIFKDKKTLDSAIIH